MAVTGFAKVTITFPPLAGEGDPIVKEYENCKGVSFDAQTGIYTVVNALGHMAAQFMLTPGILIEFETSPVLIATEPMSMIG